MKNSCLKTSNLCNISIGQEIAVLATVNYKCVILLIRLKFGAKTNIRKSIHGMLLLHWFIISSALGCISAAHVLPVDQVMQCQLLALYINRL